MAEVGVLNLTIRDNSKTAAGGLGQLAGALRAVHAAADNALSLKNVNDGLKDFAIILNRQKITQKAIKELTAFGTAMDKLSKITNAIQFDVEPLKKLKTAIGDGISIKGNPAGQIEKIRDALNGGWDNSQIAIDSMEKLKKRADAFAKGDTAKHLKDVASALTAYAKAQAAYNAATGMPLDMNNPVTFKEDFSAKGSGIDRGVVDYMAAVRGENPFPEYKSTVEESVPGLDRVKESIQAATEAAEEFNQRLRETYDLVQNTNWTWGDNTFTKFSQMMEGLYRMRSMALPAAQDNALSTDVEKGWTEWKNGAIEVEGTVKDASEGIAGYLGEPIKYLTDTASQLGNINNYLEKTDTLFERMAQSTAGSSGAFAIIPYGTRNMLDDIREMGNASGTLRDNMEEVSRSIMRAHADKYRQIPQTFADVYNGIYNGQQRQGDLTSAWLHGQGTENEQLYALRTIAEQFGMTVEEARARIEALRAAEQGLNSTTEETESRLRRLADTLGLSGRSFSKVMFGANGLNGAFARMFPSISGLIKRFGTLVKYRMLRTIIKHISEGFTEGLQNVYQYSKAVGTSLAPAMDSATSELAQMKNAIGAAAAPLVQTFIPYIKMAVSAVIEAVNWINQFFALLRGQSTWTRALPVAAEAFDKQKKSAKGASSAMKDLLADWDELNIIQSQSGGGGAGSSGTAAEDYAKMFEEVGEYNDDVKRLIKGLKQQFGSILNFATEIGAAILGWKLSEAFTGVIGMLGGLVATGAIIDLVFKASTILNGNYMQTGKTGWLVADMLTTFLGAALAKRALGNVLGGGAANIAIPLTLMFSAVAGMKSILGDVNTDALSRESLIAGIENSLKVGGAAGYLLFRFGNFGFLRSTGAGLGVAITTLGVIVGLKAIARTIDTREINERTIKSNLLSAGLVGGGLALTEAILGGTVATIAGVGIGGAVLTLGALFAIEAIIASKPVGIRWGNREYTEQEIENFVNSEAFTLDVKSTLNIIDEQVNTNKINKESIETELTKVLGDFEVIKLGIAKNQDFDKMKSDVDALIKELGKYIDSAKETGKLTLSLIPKVVGENKQDAGDWYENYVGGWDRVNAYAQEKGEKIGEILSSSERDKIVAENPKLLETLMQQLSDVTTAVTRAKINSSALSNFEFSIGADPTKKSFEELINSYDTYKAELRQRYTALANEQYQMQAELVAGLLKAAGPDDPDYKKAKATLDYMYANLVTGVEDSVEEAAKPGADRLTSILLGMVGDLPNTLEEKFKFKIGDANPFEDIGLEMLDLKSQKDAIREWAYGILYDMDAELGQYAKQGGLNPFAFMTDWSRGWIYDKLKEVFPENADELMGGLMPDMTYDVDVEGLDKPMDVPAADMSAFNRSMIDLQNSAKAAVDSVLREFDRLNGMSVDVRVHAPSNNGGGFSGGMKYYQRAEGGFVRSGDLVMANENGQFEMMGRLGHQPAVANNEQIVTGISRGVSVANDGVVSALNVLIGLAQRIERKEMVAKVVPGTGLGRANQQSANMYSRVTGV